MNSIEQYRTNYFRVKNLEAFETWVARFSTDCTRIVHKKDDDSLVAILDDSGEGVPAAYQGKDGEDDEDFDFLEDLAEQLQPGQVAIVMSSFHEGMRFVGGWAGAVNAEGARVEVGLDDIHRLAEQLGAVQTRCEW